jgi:GIY-YIG catalytic domain
MRCPSSTAWPARQLRGVGRGRRSTARSILGVGDEIWVSRYSDLIVDNGCDMSNKAQQLLSPDRLYTASEIGNRPCPVPATAGVYAFYFDEPPPGIDSKDCHRINQHALLYIGIAPKATPLNGRTASKSHLRKRLQTHYFGNAEGSTLRRTLGCLLSAQLAIRLRRVGSGSRYTFHESG